jgi:hypothetical protein
MFSDNEEFLAYMDDGDFEEHVVEEYLMKRVLSKEQKDFLHQNDLTYTMIVNGRYDGTQEPDVYAWMKSVNVTLGWRLFTVVDF